jgi:hypothetical protein
MATAGIPIVTGGATDLSLFIGVEDFTPYLKKGTARISTHLSSRSTAEFVLETPEGIALGTNMAREGQRVLFTENDELKFGGIVWTAQSRMYAKHPTAVQQSCDCVDFASVFDRRIIRGLYNAPQEPRRHVYGDVRTRPWTFEDVIQDIIAKFFVGFVGTPGNGNIASDGITANNVSVAGELRETLDLFCTGTEALDRIAAQASDGGDVYHWFVDFNGDLHFGLFNPNDAPYEIDSTSAHLIDTLVAKRTLENFKNCVYIRSNIKLKNDSDSDTNPGYRVLQLDIITANQAVIVGNFINTNPFYLDGTTRVKIPEAPDTSGIYTWDGFDGLTKNIGGFTTDDQVYGVPALENVDYKQDLESIVGRALVDGNSGRWESIVEAKDIGSLITSGAYGRGILSKFAVVPTTITYAIDMVGTQPGQRLSVDLPELNIDPSTFLITDVTLEAQMGVMPFGSIFRTTSVTAITAPAKISTGTEFIKILWNRGDGGRPAPKAETLTCVIADTGVPYDGASRTSNPLSVQDPGKVLYGEILAETMPSVDMVVDILVNGQTIFGPTFPDDKLILPAGGDALTVYTQYTLREDPQPTYIFQRDVWQVSITGGDGAEKVTVHLRHET